MRTTEPIWARIDLPSPGWLAVSSKAGWLPMKWGIGTAVRRTPT